MIKEQDLRDAIAECQGERNPNANTCIKLASYYTILDKMEKPQIPAYSYDEPTNIMEYTSGSEFSQAIQGRDVNEILEIMDELMDSIQALVPKLYDATLNKIKSQ